MEDVAECPRCQVASLTDKDHLGQCPACSFSFCSLCRDAWHTGRQCMSVEIKLELLRLRKTANATAEAELRRKEKELLHEVETLRSIVGSTMQCPACKMFVERSEGMFLASISLFLLSPLRLFGSSSSAHILSGASLRVQQDGLQMRGLFLL